MLISGVSMMQNGEEFDAQENPYAPPSSAAAERIASAFEDSWDDDSNPFLTIWIRPRRTVRRIVAKNPALHVVLLACLAGVGGTLDRASMRDAGNTIPLSVILALACVLGPIGGLISLWISSHLIRISGNWIGGLGHREHIKTAIAWASVPSVCALPLWIPQLVLFGSDMFTTEMPRLEAQPMLLVPLLAIGLVEMVLSLWGFVLLCNTVAEVQGFESAWGGFGNLILAGLIIVVPLLIIVIGLAILLMA
jgi:hypothetical protein